MIVKDEIMKEANVICSFSKSPSQPIKSSIYFCSSKNIYIATRSYIRTGHQKMGSYLHNAHRVDKKCVLAPSFYEVLIIKRCINFLSSIIVDFLWHNSMGMALDAGNNFYQELWKDARSLPTPTPYPDLTVMNPVVFTLSQATKALRESWGIALLYFRPPH